MEQGIVKPLTFKELYQRDRAEFEATLRREMLIPQKKARKLWNLGYSIEQIANGRHYDQFPDWEHANRRGDNISTEQPPLRRGKALSRRRIEEKIVHAMIERAKYILAYHSLPDVDRLWLKDIVGTLIEREAKLKEKS